MSSLPLKPPAGPKKLKKLLEKYTPREAYEILAAQIILANEWTRDTLPPSRVQTESRKITITERGLQEIRTGRYGRVQLPSQEEVSESIHVENMWKSTCLRNVRLSLRILQRSWSRNFLRALGATYCWWLMHQ